MLRQYLIVLAALPAFAQPRAFTSADYARAENFMSYNTAPLVYRAGVRPNWMENDRFWYRVTTAEGAEFILVDPAAGTRRPAFDHARVAAALSSAAGVRYDAHHLPFTEIELPADGKSVTFSAAGKAWTVRHRRRLLHGARQREGFGRRKRRPRRRSQPGAFPG